MVLESIKITNIATPVAIIAGKGKLPKILHHVLLQNNITHKIVALEGIFDDHSITTHALIRWDKWKKIGQYLKYNNIRSVVFVGKVDRPRIVDLKPDWLLAKYLPSIGLTHVGDDAVARRIANLFHILFDVEILDPHQLLYLNGCTRKMLSNHFPNQQDIKDIHRGKEVLDIISKADFGQSVVVENGRVLGVEALEGTDNLVLRCGKLKADCHGGVLIKIPKMHQEKRLDPPVIGLNTLQAVITAKLHGIAIDSQRTIVIDPETICKFANQHGIFIYHIRNKSCTN